MVQLEIVECQLVKSKFLQFTRNESVKGYLKIGGKKLSGQYITTMSYLYEYIKIHQWDEELRKTSFLQYNRFKVDVLFFCWDKTIADTFCNFHNIVVKDDDVIKQSVTEKERRGITRECFLILVSMVKNDYNEKECA